jgi:hypothetical protein
MNNIAHIGHAFMHYKKSNNHKEIILSGAKGVFYRVKTNKLISKQLISQKEINKDIKVHSMYSKKKLLQYYIETIDPVIFLAVLLRKKAQEGGITKLELKSGGNKKNTTLLTIQTILQYFSGINLVTK